MYRYYNYECPSCKYLEEVMLTPDEEVEIECPKCGLLLERLLSAPMFLKASYPDGTKRFQAAREAFEKKKFERDNRKAKK